MKSPESPEWYTAGHHWVGPLNYDTTLQEGFHFPKPVTILDGTIRKILFTPGVRPTTEDLLAVAEELEQLGVREMILNVDWWGDPEPDAREYEVCRAILGKRFEFRTTVGSDSIVPYPIYGEHRAPVPWKTVIETLTEIGATRIQIPLGPSGDRPTSQKQFELVEQIVSHARSIGVDWVFGLGDVGRWAYDDLIRTAGAGVRLGASRIDLVDSFASLSPEAMRSFIAGVRAAVPYEVPLTIHVHNDFGLATAAALAAASAGAHPEVAVGGLSYRSGFASLEEVVLALELLYGVKTGLQLDRLQRLADLVATCVDLPERSLTAITGTHSYVIELPPWVINYLQAGPDDFAPPGLCFAPAVVGARPQAVWGYHPSNLVIRAKLDEMQIPYTEDDIQEIRRRVAAKLETLTEYPWWLSEPEVEAICRLVVA